MPNNHVIDPTFFYQAIESFSFEYDFYRLSEQVVDDYGKQKGTYEYSKIRGSLQTQGQRIRQRREGNIVEETYNFYCKSLYRIDKGDFIYYQHKLMRCDEVHSYDEYGVREATLKVVSLSTYQDLAEYIKYIEGRELV